MGDEAVTLDFSKAQSLDQSAVTLDFSKAQPLEPKGNAPGTVTGDTATIGAGHGRMVRSADSEYSHGYAGVGDAPRASGHFLDRALNTMGEDLSHPSNLLPSWKDLAVPGWTATENAYHDWQAARHGNVPTPDPAVAVGHMGVPLLGAAVTGGLSPEADVPVIRPDPRIERAVPNWRTNPGEGTEVPSIVNQQPYAGAARTAPAATPPVSVSPMNQVRPRLRGISPREFAELHEIDPQVEGSPLPEIESEVENTPRRAQPQSVPAVPDAANQDYTALLKKSVKAAKAAKAARRARAGGE